MARLLTDDEIAEGVRKLPGWARDGNFIAKNFVFEEFMDGIHFVDRVAEVGERMDHHPDIQVRYTKVRLMVQTHDAGGITAKDLKLASAISDVEQSFKKRLKN